MDKLKNHLRKVGIFWAAKLERAKHHTGAISNGTSFIRYSRNIKGVAGMLGFNSSRYFL